MRTTIALTLASVCLSTAFVAGAAMASRPIRVERPLRLEPTPAEATTTTAATTNHAPRVAAERRDPFAAYPDDVISCFGEGPLQRFPVDAMKVQGIIAGTTSPRALVLLPDGTTHLVRVGTNVGKNFGLVASIGPKGVLVVEEFRDPIMGKRIPQRTLLAVR